MIIRSIKDRFFFTHESKSMKKIKRGEIIPVYFEPTANPIQIPAAIKETIAVFPVCLSATSPNKIPEKMKKRRVISSVAMRDCTISALSSTRAIEPIKDEAFEALNCLKIKKNNNGNNEPKIAEVRRRGTVISRLKVFPIFEKSMVP